MGCIKWPLEEESSNDWAINYCIAKTNELDVELLLELLENYKNE